MANEADATAPIAQTPGSAAAMREALNEVGNAAAWIAESCNDRQTAKYMNDIIAIVQSALSKPARNCDTNKTPRELLEEYLRERGFSSPNQIGAICELALPVVEWLLAPATERKP